MNSRQLEYILSPQLEEAVLVSEVTSRPLLIKGEPGTGKTLLAEHVATARNWPLFSWHVKSTSVAKDGLYSYDALSRLNDARFTDIEKGESRVHNIENYIRLEAMGEAFDYDGNAVLLIDEIDKADIEFPNDLLLELDRMEFKILETGRQIKARQRPLVFITSNNEKELPDAFLRRCIFHYIEFPTPAFMEDIVKAHFPSIASDLLKQSLDLFYRLRGRSDLSKPPSTSELIDWLSILLHQGAKPESGKAINYLGALIKNEEDLQRLVGKFR